MDAQTLNPKTLTPQALDLRDIHLPEAISWWPIAPGWWLLAAGLLLALLVIIIARKVFLSRQLKRDIKVELENIKQQFQQTQNKSQLAKSLSILIRRTTISYYPSKNIAGLTGENWLVFLDQTNANASADIKFESRTGNVLLTAPYQSEDSLADFDSQTFIRLCESWLLSHHNKTLPASIS